MGQDISHLASQRFDLVPADIPELTDEIANALYEAGCDDATISMRSGRVYLTFDHEAASMKDAVLSAIRDIRKAGFEPIPLSDAQFNRSSGSE